MSAAKKKPRMGRPPLPEGQARTIGFTVRITEAEQEVLATAAARAGKPVAKWARAALIEAAGKA